MHLTVLFIEDDEKIAQNLKKLFDGETISGCKLSAVVSTSFSEGIDLVKARDLDLVVLDLFKDRELKDEEAGIKVLNEIRKIAFIPVVFYTGHAFKINSFASEIVGIVDKGDVSGGIKALKIEIERIINSRIATLKNQIYSHLKESLRKYFWETVDTNKEVFAPGNSDVSLGYLLLRRFANSLSKENIKLILGDDKIKPDKAHPMEFYIFPVNPDSTIEEYVAGEILEKEAHYFVILTPDCDLVLRSNRSRKADKILLASAKKFKSLPDYVKYSELKNKANRTAAENNQFSNLEGKLKTWMSNRGGEQDRFFFLPETPFIENMVVDFQDKNMVEYGDLKGFRRVARLDLPYAQSMISSFIRYYNRIGFPDIDVDFLIKTL